jgi:hypothetical protein
MIAGTAWAAAWEAGRTLSLDQAIAEALGVGGGDDQTAPRME